MKKTEGTANCRKFTFLSKPYSHKMDPKVKKPGNEMLSPIARTKRQ